MGFSCNIDLALNAAFPAVPHCLQGNDTRIIKHELTSFCTQEVCVTRNQKTQTAIKAGNCYHEGFLCAVGEDVPPSGPHRMALRVRTARRVARMDGEGSGRG